MKRILVDIYLAFNLGDDMFLDVLTKRYPNAEFTIFHPGNNYNEFFSLFRNVKRFQYTFKHKIFRKFGIYDKLIDYDEMAKEFDALVFLGGGIFREESYADKLYEYRVSIISSFKHANKRTFFLGCSFGPYKTKGFFNNYFELFNKCDDVCFRDKYSYELFKKLENVRYAPDILWSYKFEEEISKEKTVGYSIISPKHKEGLENYYDLYVEKIVASIVTNYTAGYHIKLFSFCEPEGDLLTINEVFKEIPQQMLEKVEIINYRGNIKAFLDRFSKIEVLYASRFHANILGLLYNIKTIPIVYSIKTTNLLRDIKFEGEVIEFSNLEKICKIDIRALDNKFKSYHKKGVEHFKYLDNFLN